MSFSDYFLADRNKFLNRRLDESDRLIQTLWIPWFMVVSLLLGVFAYFSRLLRVWVISLFFTFGAYGLMFISRYQYGWEVFYGPQVVWLAGVQIALLLLSFLIIWILSKSKKLNLWLLPLSFGIDPIIQVLRFSFISGKYYFGIALDNLRFLGVSFNKLSFNFLNQDLPGYQAAALLKFDYSKIWDNLFMWSVIYPLIHILLAIILGYLFLKLPIKIRNTMLGVLIILFILHILNILQADPRIATPVLY